MTIREGLEVSTGIRLALAGDTMLGRGAAEALRTQPIGSLISEDAVAILGEADLFVLNLECCVSKRGERWPNPLKPFFFRAPPLLDLLRHLGVDCVTVANNHALDFGRVALVDTLDLLSEAGVATVGAVRDLQSSPFCDHGELRLPAAGGRVDRPPGRLSSRHRHAGRRLRRSSP